MEYKCESGRPGSELPCSALKPSLTPIAYRTKSKVSRLLSPCFFLDQFQVPSFLSMWPFPVKSSPASFWALPKPTPEFHQSLLNLQGWTKEPLPPGLPWLYHPYSHDSWKTSQQFIHMGVLFVEATDWFTHYTFSARAQARGFQTHILSPGPGTHPSNAVPFFRKFQIFVW